MEFEIPCEVFARLATVTQKPDSGTSQWFNSVRIERKHGTVIAIATNKRIMALELLDKQAGPNSSVHVPINPLLLEQCKSEIPFGSKLHIVVNDMLKFASAKTTFGYNHIGNAGMFLDEPNEFDKWPEIVKSVGTKSKGAMFWDAELIAILASSSPTGRVVFAEHIDATKPSVMRDLTDDRWFGLFVPMPSKTNDGVAATAVQPAKVPNWVVL